MVCRRANDLDADLEYRTTDFTVREVSPGPGGNVVRGTAIVFERWQRVAAADARAVAGGSRKREKVTTLSVDLPDLSEFVNEAVDAELRKRYNDVRALVNHDSQRYLGSMFKRSLKLTKTAETLDFELTVPETTDGNNMLAIMRNENGVIATSVGFVSKGRNSNVKQIDFDDDDLEAELGDTRAVVNNTNVLDKTPINTQEGKLNGSDYVEGVNVKNGRNWRVYRSFDLREISFLIGQEPAWQGVYGQLGSGRPEPTPQQQARQRELDMLELRC